MESWKLSLKAVALYRDGSKLSQPLNTSSDDDTADDQEIDDIKQQDGIGGTVALVEASKPGHKAVIDVVATPAPVERIVERIVERPLRRRLADTRTSITHKFDIAGHEGYITVGLFDDNTPGEVFVTMAKQGSTVGGLMDTIATLISLNLQYGVPLEAIVRKFEHMRFEPSGMTMNPDIPFAKSPIDYLVRWMGMQFIPGYRAANSPRKDMNNVETLEPTLFAASDSGVQVPITHAVPAIESRLDAPVGANGSSGQGNGRHELPSGSSIKDAAQTGHGGPSLLSPSQSSKKAAVADDVKLRRSDSVLSQQMATLMGDAPVCTCGSITVRNGSCYKCLNCGSSLGCS
jgi:ribonucleoside-diphosphate reductase alpha chain